jgi:hypothetical protein
MDLDHMIAYLKRLLLDHIASTRVVDSEDIVWSEDGGLQAHFRDEPEGEGGGTGSSCFPCKITAKSGAFYTVDKYENGIDEATTGEAQVYVLQLAMADTVPNDVWIIVSPSAIGVTGGA